MITTVLWILSGLGLIVAVVTGALWIRLRKNNQRVEQELQEARIERLTDLEAVKTLSLTPLVEYYAADGLSGEAGVSYLIRADETTLLMDVGANEKKAHPSILISNMTSLGVSPGDLNGLVISHIHQDHVGGLREERGKSFSLSRGRVDLPPIPVWAPEPLSCSPYNPGARPQVVHHPVKIAKGLALTGPMPASLFLLGYLVEQALVVNVLGKGLVVVIGCGHPTLPVILNRVKAMLDAPIYAVIGGLHLPVHGGRMNLGPLNLQNLVGSDRMPWHSLGEEDVTKTLAVIQKESPALVALSPHDSSDWTMERFKQALGQRYRPMEVGRIIEI